MSYGALSTKVRALFGKRLRLADFQQLAALSSESEILDYLRHHSGWSRALNQLQTDAFPYVGRIEVEGMLREELRLEYLALHHFVPRGDKLMMQFRIRLAEREAILNALRQLRTGKYAKGMPASHTVVLQGKIDYSVLRAAETYDEILAAARTSIYYPVLLHLRSDEGAPLPDYTLCESLLEAAYFTYMFRLIRKQYSGATQKVLLQAFGEQVDLMNLIHILRLKTYFPDTLADTYLTILYPFNHKLSPQVTQDLCAAPNPEAVLALIRQTPYARQFDNVAVETVEDYYRRAFYTFNRRQLLSGAPSVYTAMAYLSMKETELRVVVNIIESVKYGVPYDEGFAALVGA